MKKVLIAFLLVVGMARIGKTQNSQFDGSDWNKFPELTKITYVIGFVEGVERATSLRTGTLMQNTYKDYVTLAEKFGVKPITPEVFTVLKMLSDTVAVFVGIKYEQIKQGLDEVFSRFENQHLYIAWVITDVAKMIKGELTREQLEKNLTAYRKIMTESKGQIK
jgi:hypothetical protein